MHDDERDILISRIVDGDADDAIWNALATIAARDPAIWRDLASAQRDDAALMRLVGRADEVAHRVPIARPQAELPARRVTAPHGGRRHAWTGWAVAAVIFLAWTSTVWQGPATAPADATSKAGVVPVFTAQDALAAYLEKGRAEDRVIQEMPRKVLINTRPVGQGFEVIYLRQVMERTVVPNLYQFQGEDEGGQPVLVRYQPQPGGSM